jgi:two-component system response regulator HydG
VIAATHAPLEQRVREGRFRDDLYYRLNGAHFALPPLRERSDLGAMLDRMLAAVVDNQPAVRLAPAARALLLAHRWPGNLRELNNVVKRAVLLTRGNKITTAELTQAMGQIRTDNVLQLHDEDTERQRIITALQQTNGNKAKAARLLGVDRKTIYNKIEKLGI